MCSAAHSTQLETQVARSVALWCLFPSWPRASQVTQLVKNPPAIQETWVWSLGGEDPLGEEMATHSSILAWEIPQRSLVGYSPWGHKESDTTELLNSSSSWPNASHTLLPFLVGSITEAPGCHAFVSLPSLHLLGILKARLWEWGKGEETAGHLRSLLGGAYHSRSCLPPGCGCDAHMSPGAAAGLLGNCCTGRGQGRCRFRRLGGRAHRLPSLGHRGSQGHSSSRSCPLCENTRQEAWSGSLAGWVRCSAQGQVLNRPKGGWGTFFNL